MESLMAPKRETALELWGYEFARAREAPGFGGQAASPAARSCASPRASGAVSRTTSAAERKTSDRTPRRPVDLGNSARSRQIRCGC
jgi:hypothetical protein